jgi:hypothetical protein
MNTLASHPPPPPIGAALMSPPNFDLHRTALGRLVLTCGDERHEGVVPVRNFPMSAPEAGLSLVDAEGRERLWIAHLDQLPDEPRRLIEEELRSREFTPHIHQITAVSTFNTPSTWQVETDRGPTALVLKGEEDIRRLPHNGSLLITDAQGIQFILPDPGALDRRSKRLLERFL